MLHEISCDGGLTLQRCWHIIWAISRKENLKYPNLLHSTVTEDFRNPGGKKNRIHEKIIHKMCDLFLLMFPPSKTLEFVLNTMKFQLKITFFSFESIIF